MKKLIVFIVIILVILLAVTLIDRGGSVSVNRSDVVQDQPKDAYDLALSDELTYVDVLGCDLPKSASDIHTYIDFSNFLWTGLVVAKLPMQDFYHLVEKLDLAKQHDLLKFWPDAFLLDENIDSFQKYWGTANVVNEDTFYYEHPEDETSMAAKYENGTLYFKKETIYILAGTDIRGTTLFKKAKRE